MPKLLTELRSRFPQFQFVAGKQFCWSPETQEIIYKDSLLVASSKVKSKKLTRATYEAKWSLLHETAHALLGHASYQADFKLILLEVAAWEKARELAIDYAITIDEEHIQDCLDTYRDWLYRRSICPSCKNKSLQQGDFVHYHCFNCHSIWRVTPSRFGRTYRKNIASQPANLIFQ